MILGIDAGNTNIVIGGIQDGELLFSERKQTEVGNIEKLLNTVKDRTFEGAILSSVVPWINDSIIRCVRKAFGLETILVSAQIKMNISLPEHVKKEIGADIIVGLCAAATEYETPLAVVDMGTASTVFLLDKDFVLAGGTIHPGIGIELNALSSKTSLLPRISTVEIPERVLGQNTNECILSGVVYGHAGMIDSILDHMEEEIGSEINAVATGGLGRYVTPVCRHKLIYDESLLIKGLDLLYKMNS